MPTVYTNIISWLEQHQLPCLLKNILHTDCPGCGFQRSFIALLQGNISESFIFYPAMLPMLAFFFYLFLTRNLNHKHAVVGTKAGIALIFVIIAGSYLYKLTAQNYLP